MNALVFEILDYWHAGAGHGAGRFLDATVMRSRAGLPFLPGRTVKGLLRQAVSQCEGFGHLAAGTTELLFGSEIAGETDRFETKTGQLQIGSAELEGDWEGYVASEEGRGLLPAFFDSIASTALDGEAGGLAKKGSLRRIEVAIPLRLVAFWSVSDAEHQVVAEEALRMALPLLRSIGSGATRGLGRVQVTLENSGQEVGR